jgi:hypothetical protein
MSLGTLGLAFLAGALSVLSPCVLPLLPIMLGSAASEHRLAPAALAAGLSLSFVVIGRFKLPLPGLPGLIPVFAFCPPYRRRPRFRRAGRLCRSRRTGEKRGRRAIQFAARGSWSVPARLLLGRGLVSLRRPTLSAPNRG